MDIQSIYEAVLDNTASIDNYQELGIFKFAKMFFPDRFKDPFSTLHYDMVSLLFQILDPNKHSAVDRKRYFLVHREAAKTTVGNFLFPAYLTYLKGHNAYVRAGMLGYSDSGEYSNKIIEIPINEKFIVIASATTRSAEDFIINLKDTLDTRQDLADIFGEKNPKYVEDEEVRGGDKRWTKSLFVTADGQAIKGVGIGQQVRGANIKGSRPTLIIVDDIYTEDNILTEHSRKKVSKWYQSALENSLDSKDGKILALGTLLHPDTIFNYFDKNPMYKGINRPIIALEDLQMVISRMKDDEIFDQPEFFNSPDSIKYFEDLSENIKSLSWVERHPLRNIMIKYYEKYIANDLNWFYQEYMNEPIAPEMKMISEDSFYRTKIEWDIRNGQQQVQFQYKQALWYGVCNLFIGVDPASSEATNSDDTVIVVAGYANCFPKIPGMDLTLAIETKQNKIFPIIAHVEGGKYSIYNYMSMKGMCESIDVLTKRYVIQHVKVEANGQQEQIVREVRKYLPTHRVQEEFHHTNKSERILSIMYSIIQKYDVIICPKFPLIDKVFIQLLTCGMSDHDDYADATAISFSGATIPDYVNEYVHSDSKVQTEARYYDLKKMYGNDAWMYI